MASHKIDRTAEDIKRELSDIFRGLKDTRISGMLSIVKLDLARDLSYCKVYISSMDGFESAKESVKGLNNAAGYIRHEINARLSLRRSPQFKFEADDSIEHSAEISKILNDLHLENPKNQ